MELRLSLTDISKSYDGRAVFEACSYTFDREGVYVLMGPNGCGKSTFLRICALLEEPDSGRVSYLSSSDPLRKDMGLMRRISLVLPRAGLFNSTVFQNVAYGLRIRGEKRGRIREMVKEALDFVALAHKSDQNSLSLSSGEAQRVGIARALVISPEILFLDEPTASVDRENAALIEQILLKLRQEKGTVIVMTTHDRSQAERVGDRLLFLEKGALLPQ